MRELRSGVEALREARMETMKLAAEQDHIQMFSQVIFEKSEKSQGVVAAYDSAVSATAVV
jgi:hypothetical protein